MHGSNNSGYSVISFIILGALMFVAGTARAQLSGSHTVGSGGDFGTLDAALTELNNSGVSGPVTLEVMTGTYTLDASLTLSLGSDGTDGSGANGTSAADTVTIESRSGNAADVVLEFRSTESDGPPVLRLDGADFVTLQNLTWNPIGRGFGDTGRALTLQGELEGVVIRNNVFQGRNPERTSDDHALIYGQDFSTADAVRIIDNAFSGGPGIWFDGPDNDGSAPAASAVIRGNTFEETVQAVFASRTGVEIRENEISASEFLSNGLQVQSIADAQIVGNQIESEGGGDAITAVNLAGALRIQENEIALNDDGTGIYVSGSGETGLIANNLIDIVSPSTQPAIGISVNESAVRLFHNSIRIESGRSRSAALKVEDATPTIRNNILAAMNKGMALWVPSGEFPDSDFNDLYAAGLLAQKGRGPTAESFTLAELQAQGVEANSVSVVPVFRDDLATQSPYLDDAGTDLTATVPRDVLGASRPAAPSLGAFQYTSTAGPPLVPGVYAVGTGGEYETLREAFDDLKLRGVDAEATGAVELALLDGTFTGGLTLTAVPGITADRPLTIRSEANDATQVIVQDDGTEETDFVLKLAGVHHVRIRGLTVSPQPDGPKGLLFAGVTEALDLEGNIFEFPGPDGSGETLLFGEGIRFLGDVTLTDNTFQNAGGGRAIEFEESAGNGLVRLTDNSFSGFERAVHLEGFTGASIEGNSFVDNSSAIFVMGHDPEVLDNRIEGSLAGIDMDASGAVRIERNRVEGSVHVSGRFSENSGPNGLVANNLIRAVEETALEVTTSNRPIAVYHNSVFTSSGTACALEADDAALTFQNNICATADGTVLQLSESGVSSDYNNLFSANGNIARLGFDELATLVDLQAEGYDAGSLSVNPVFEDDLTTESPFLDDAGTDLTATVPADINGSTRPASPSLGAIQYTSTLGGPVEPGTYTIGSGGDYESLAAAFDNLQLRHVDDGGTGPVELVFEAGTYNTGGLALGTVPGVNADRPLVIRSEANDPATVTLRHAPAGETDNYILRLEGARHVRIEGLTWAPQGEAFGRAISFSGETGNIEITGNVLEGVGLPQDGGGSESRRALIARDETTGWEPQGPVQISNNTFRQGSYGILMALGFSAEADLEVEVTDNNFKGQHVAALSIQEAANALVQENAITILGQDGAAQGIDIQDTPGAQVLDNTVELEASANAEYAGIDLQGSPKAVLGGNSVDVESMEQVFSLRGIRAYGESLRIEDNRVDVSGTAGTLMALDCNSDGMPRVLRNRLSVTASSASFPRAASLRVAGDGTDEGGLIANNEVVLNAASGGEDVNAVTVTGSNHRVYHNSVLLISERSTGAAFRAVGFGVSDVDLKNNIFAAVAEGLAVNVDEAAAVNSDYNNLYTARPTLVRWGDNDVPTLAELQALETDAHSVSVVPAFTSNTDLSTRSSWIDDNGADLSGVVPEDIAGQVRPATPSLGAHQIDNPIAPLEPGTYVVGQNGTYADLDTAINALLSGGVEPASSNQGDAEEVTFALEPGTYNGQNHVLPEVPGASMQRPVVLTSTTGAEEDVTIEYEAAGENDNYVLYLLGADFVTLRHLTLRATGQTHATVLQVDGPAEGLRVERCTLSSVGGADASGDFSVQVQSVAEVEPALIDKGLGDQASAVYSMGDLEFRLNYVTAESRHGDAVTYAAPEFSGFNVGIEPDPNFTVRNSTVSAENGTAVRIDADTDQGPSGEFNFHSLEVTAQYDLFDGYGVSSAQVQDVRGQSTSGNAFTWGTFGSVSLRRSHFTAPQGLDLDDGEEFSEENVAIKLVYGEGAQDAVAIRAVDDVDSFLSGLYVPDGVDNVFADISDIGTLQFRYGFWELEPKTDIFYQNVENATIENSAFDFVDDQMIQVDGSEVPADQFVQQAGNNWLTEITWAPDGLPGFNPALIVDNPNPGMLVDVSGSIRVDVDPDADGLQTLVGPFGTFGQDVADLPDPEASSNFLFAGSGGDPVNTFTGGLTIEVRPDLAPDGPLPMVFRRYYGSFLARDRRVRSALGPNWAHNFDRRLIEVVTGTVEVVTHRGRVTVFNEEGGTWTQANHPARPLQLVEEADGYRLANPRTHRIYTFDSGGALTKIEDSVGNSLTLNYDNGHLTEVSDGLGRKLAFTYDGDRLADVSDGTRTVEFGYTDGVLTSVTGPLDNTATYAYDSEHSMEALLTGITRPEGNTPLTNTYDAQGRVATQTDARGNTTTFTYEAGRTTVTDPLEKSYVHVYDEAGRLTQFIDRAGRTVHLDYNAEGQRSRITDRMGAVTEFGYDAVSGLLTSTTHANDTTTTRTYETYTADGMTFYDLESVTFPDGTTVTIDYDPNGNPTSITNRAGETWTATYNNRGQVLTRTNPKGATVTVTYNGDGTPASVENPAGNTTSFVYDSLRRITGITRADDSTRTFSYDDAGRLTSLTDEQGRSYSFTSDGNGNLIRVTDPNGKTVEFTYDATDRVTSATDRLGNSSNISYDELGRPAILTDRNGNTTTFQYDALGRLVTTSDGEGQTTGYSYDAEGILTDVTNPDGGTWSLVSNNMGWVKQITSPLGRSTGLEYDPVGSVISVQDPSQTVTALSRGPAGLIHGVTLPDGTEASYQRDALGGITGRVDPNGNSWQTPRNVQGLPTAETDPLGQSTGFKYNGRNRVTDVTQPGGLGTITLTYEGTGRLTGLSHTDGTSLDFNYDANGRFKGATGIAIERDAEGRITRSNGLAVGRDAEGRIQSVTLPGGTIEYSYNGADQLIRVEDWLGGVTRFSYDKAGRPTSIVRPNGTTTQYTYDADGRLTDIEQSKDAETLAEHAFDRDDRTRVLRVEGETPAPASAISETRVFQVDAAGQVESFSYDALGRLLEDDLRTYSWNGFSRLTIYSDDTRTVDCTYDAMGLRLSRSTGGSTQTYVWNYALRLPSIAVERENGSDRRYYVHTPSGQLLYSIEASGNARHYYHYDELGNTKFITDETTAVVAAYAYTPYGERIARQGTLEQPFTWQGKFGVMSEGEGLYYMRARYYDARTGRFLSRDPVKTLHPADANPYQYARGNPKRFIDPAGLAVVGSSVGPFQQENGEDVMDLSRSGTNVSQNGGGSRRDAVTRFGPGNQDGGADPGDACTRVLAGDAQSTQGGSSIAPVARLDPPAFPDPEPDTPPDRDLEFLTRPLLSRFQVAAEAHSFEIGTAVSGGVGNIITTVTLGNYGDGCSAWRDWTWDWLLEEVDWDKHGISAVNRVHTGTFPVHNFVTVDFVDGRTVVFDPWRDPDNPFWYESDYEAEHGEIEPGSGAWISY